MRKLILFMHTSLDGIVCGPNREMDWIHVDEELFEYAGRMTQSSDLAIYGRVTYELMDAYWPNAADQPNASKHDIEHSAWYNSVNKVVVSRTMKGVNIKNTIILSENIPDAITAIKKQPGKNIIVFGSPGIAHTLMKHNLIDDYWIFINPILIGEGTPLFSNINQRINLTLAESKIFNSGVAMLHYTR